MINFDTMNSETILDLFDVEPINEKRISERAFLTVAVTLEIGDRLVRGVECKNVSLGGMFLISKVHIPLGSVGTVTLTKRCDKKRVSFSADFEVVRHEGETKEDIGLGLKFIRLTDEDRLAVEFIVDFRTGVTLRERLDLSEEKISDIRFKIAQTQEELAGAFSLVHDSYVTRGYMDPDPSGMRLSIHHAMPLTTVVIGVQNNRVIAASALFLDSPIGLPMDNLYKRELSEFRQNRRLIAEIGAFAVHQDLRAFTTTLVLHLQKLMFLYTFRYLNLDDIVLVINPRHKLYYQHVLLANQIGPERVYQKVKGNPAIAMSMDVRKAQDRFKESYSTLPDNKNLHRFFYEHTSECLQMPELRQPIVTWNRALLHYFFEERSKLFETTSADTIKFILSHYEN